MICHQRQAGFSFPESGFLNLTLENSFSSKITFKRSCTYFSAWWIKSWHAVKLIVTDYNSKMLSCSFIATIMIIRKESRSSFITLIYIRPSIQFKEYSTLNLFDHYAYIFKSILIKEVLAVHVYTSIDQERANTYVVSMWIDFQALSFYNLAHQLVRLIFDMSGTTVLCKVEKCDFVCAWRLEEVMQYWLQVEKTRWWSPADNVIAEKKAPWKGLPTNTL